MYSTCKSLNLNWELVVRNYDLILSYLFASTSEFSIVVDLVKPYSRIPPSFKQDFWVSQLADYLVSSSIGAREWPGTVNRDAHKTLMTYVVSSNTKKIVQKWPNVFAACDNGLPEDICFYSNGTVRFATISHERTACAGIFSEKDKLFYSQFI